MENTQEEPKQERKIDTCHNFDIEIGCTQTYCSCEDEEPLKSWESDIANGLNSFIDTQIGNKPIKQREPKQETLEEAAECKSHHSEEDFIRGAKWQAERMYREEEVDELVNNLIGKFLNYNGSYVDNEKLKWFYQQIKKEIE